MSVVRARRITQNEKKDKKQKSERKEKRRKGKKEEKRGKKEKERETERALQYGNTREQRPLMAVSTTSVG